MFWGRIALGFILVAGAVIALGPRERVRLGHVTMDLPTTPDEWLAQRERGIRAEVASYLRWAEGPGRQADVAIVYVHGFSASPGELRPLPEDLARSLGANLLAIRLTGHGQDGQALAQARAQDWWRDLAQALFYARQMGRKVVVLGMSTGAALVAEAARDPQLSTKFDAAILLSPNFRMRNKWAWALRLPWLRQVLAVLGDPERCFKPRNDLHAALWTHCYPVAATLPVAALNAQIQRGDFIDAKVPALFIWSDRDRIVDHRVSQYIADSWGGQVQTLIVEPGPRDDPDAHVIAGDALSPAMNQILTQAISDWISKTPAQNVKEK
ncbi:alpha/beta fold hydrolase [Paracoccus sp. 11-3]|uniref:Alpha/beta fold hydrolase n=1 Tax=Paracoccus amoyensis TaxID=2760093 RepID=A0A926GQW0_9RHOB|nr:alpha/beta fold hydrolase [Paracoccus amoyensis]MBC9248270.1 alpha/beta fold hydrolase [Paracoccus amoyensis]